MSRGELAIVTGLALCSIGAGLFHPGFGFLVAGIGVALFGVLEIRFPADEPAEGETAVDEARAA